ncbi:MAG: hypothetical protein ACRDMY_14755, partial [Gaiellaceae bacterium]
MDGLVEDGFVVLGGPLGDGERVLLVVEAADEREIEARLAADPWLPMGILEIATIGPGRSGSTAGRACSGLA